ncbi:unnamed protein product [Amoebophrya sp. A120]|nr:unnamed protein product [Amoebophrya sp. A120]|eukprot:GSA120T00014200001.1
MKNHTMDCFIIVSRPFSHVRTCATEDTINCINSKPKQVSVGDTSLYNSL